MGAVRSVVALRTTFVDSFAIPNSDHVVERHSRQEVAQLGNSLKLLDLEDVVNFMVTCTDAPIASIRLLRVSLSNLKTR